MIDHVKDIRPGDVWLEEDGDDFFVIGLAVDTDSGKTYIGYTNYLATDPEGHQVEVWRRPRDLKTLVYRQEDDVIEHGQRMIQGMVNDLVANQRRLRFETKDSGERAEYASGMVRDTQEGKARFDLLRPQGVPYSAQFLTRVAELLERGAQKYGDRNWEKANSQEEVDRMLASGERHMQQYLAGDTDEDHAAAVVFNLLAAETTKWKMENQ